MALWKDNTAPARPNPIPPLPEAKEATQPVRYDAPPPKPEAVHTPAPTPAPVTRTESHAPRKESLIAADITIEGKIEGGGSVRIAGNFKGDVNVDGDLALESGAKLIEQAGYQPIEMSNIWRQLIGEEQASARYRRKRRDRGYDLFATHPAPEDRMADLKADALEVTVPVRAGSRLVGDASVAVERVHSDTRSLQPGDLFVALKGERFDGHALLDRAKAGGAVAALGRSRRGEVLAARRAVEGGTARRATNVASDPERRRVVPVLRLDPGERQGRRAGPDRQELQSICRAGRSQRARRRQVRHHLSAARGAVRFDGARPKAATRLSQYREHRHHRHGHDCGHHHRRHRPVGRLGPRARRDADRVAAHEVRAVLRGRGGGRARDYLPYDLPEAADRLLRALTPDLLVFAKVDLWPELAATLANR